MIPPGRRGKTDSPRSPWSEMQMSALEAAVEAQGTGDDLWEAAPASIIHVGSTGRALIWIGKSFGSMGEINLDEWCHPERGWSSGARLGAAQDNVGTDSAWKRAPSQYPCWNCCSRAMSRLCVLWVPTNLACSRFPSQICRFYLKITSNSPDSGREGMAGRAKEPLSLECCIPEASWQRRDEAGTNYGSIPINEGTQERRAQPMIGKPPSERLQLERSLLIALINLSPARAEQLREEQLQGRIVPGLSLGCPTGPSHGGVTPRSQQAGKGGRWVWGSREPQRLSRC